MRAERFSVAVPFGGTKLVFGPIWPLTIAVTTWAVRTYYVPVLGASLSSTQAWIATVAILVGAMFSLLVHCVGHLTVARLLHTDPPERLPLYPSGDAAQAWPSGVSPAADTWISLCGPFANLAVAAVAYLAWGFEPATAPNAIILFLVLLNIGIAGINLAPGFPLDGGRLIRAEVWQSSGSADLGTRLSTRLGWGICLLLFGWAAFLYQQQLRFSTETSAITFAVVLLIALQLLAERPHYSEATPATQPRPKRLARLRDAGEICAAVLILSLAPIMLLPTNLGMEAPGPTASVEPMVHVPPDQAHPAQGTFILTTVVPQAPIVVAEWLYAQYDHAIRITQAREIVSSNTSPQQVAIQGFRDLKESEKTAIVVGLKQAGYDASLTYTGARIVAIQPASEANGVLLLGDEITLVNGQPVSGPSDVSRILRADASAGSAEISVQRGDQKIDLTVPLMHDESGAPKIGINVEPTGDHLQLPFPVSITPEKVDGGPSAGLMFTLTLYNALTPSDLTKGYRIAGTGTIDLDGNVGAIGGVQQKVAAAERSGAEYFLVPVDNYADAAAMASHIKVIKVATLDDAVSFLNSLPQRART